MFRPLGLFIGLRMLGARRRNQTVSFFSASSIVGITLGVSVLILVLSAMNGFQRELEQRLLAVLPQAELHALDGQLDNWPELMESALQHPNVTAAAPYIEFPALLQRGDQNEPLQVRGVQAAAEARASALDELMLEGDWRLLDSDQQQLILSRRLAERLGLSVGDSVVLLVLEQPEAGDNLIMQAPKLKRFVIGGLFASAGQLEQNLALMPLRAAAEVLGLTPGGSSGAGSGVGSDEGTRDVAAGIRLTLADPFLSARTVADIGYSWRSEFLMLKDWTRTQGYLYQDIQMVRLIAYIVLLLVILVASFNVISTLVVTVRDKQGDIAILQTMGASRPLLMGIFLVQGLINGLIGVALGAALGCGLGWSLPLIAQAVESVTGIQLLSADIYFIDYIPSQVLASDVTAVCFCSLLICFLAAWYPAWQATRQAPAQALGRAV